MKCGKFDCRKRAYPGQKYCTKEHAPFAHIVGGDGAKKGNNTMLRKIPYETPVPMERLRFDAERAPFLHDELQAREAKIKFLEATVTAQTNEIRELRTMLHRATRIDRRVEALTVAP